VLPCLVHRDDLRPLCLAYFAESSKYIGKITHFSLDAEMNGLVEGPGEKWVILRIPSSVSQAILPGESHCNGQDGDKIGPPAGVLARGMSYEYLHL
jgi:hypothetical protein